MLFEVLEYLNSEVKRNLVSVERERKRERVCCSSSGFGVFGLYREIRSRQKERKEKENWQIIGGRE